MFSKSCPKLRDEPCGPFILLLAISSLSGVAQAADGWLETWAYRTADTPNSFTNMVQVRYYQPFAIPHVREGWQGMMRLDTSIVSNSGPAFPGESGNQFNPGNTRFTLWANTPNIAQNTHASGGFRILAPTGDKNPNYSSGQWAAGPQAGLTWAPRGYGIFTDFSPTVRYMIGFSPVSAQVTNPKSWLELYPSIGLRFSERITMRLWDENQIQLNTNSGIWFVPMDAYLTYELTNHWSASLGAAKHLNNMSQYDWSGYGRFAYHF